MNRTAGKLNNCGPLVLPLFLEATQLKTAPIGRFAGHSGEKAVVEAQVAGIGTRKRRRPAVPATADAPQRTGAIIAVARDRVSSYSWRQRNGRPRARLLAFCGVSQLQWKPK